jgi:hypothetical protein
MIEDPNRTDNKILEYLITSNTRRNLLALLWGKGISGSSAQLSELVGSARSGVHAELRAMLRVE